MGSGIDNLFPSFCKHESENCKTKNLLANSRFNCIENVNAEHQVIVCLYIVRFFFGINVKDGEPQVIANCVWFSDIEGWRPFSDWSSLGWIGRLFFAKKIEYNHERPSSLDSLSL